MPQDQAGQSNTACSIHKLGSPWLMVGGRRLPNRAQKQCPQQSGHSTKPGRLQEAFGQCSEAHDVTLGLSFAGPDVGL